jgi:DNA-binding response OmpR family regulator
MSKILVVEDEPNLRALLSRMLGAAGYSVATAATGADGLKLALAEPYDLVVLDLMLPDLTGEQTMRVLLASRPETRILVLSSALEARRRVAVLESGASDFLGKPFVNSELLARVRLRMSQSPATPAGTPSRIEIDGDAHLDVTRRELVMNGHRISLSQREFTLLTHLAEHRGATCSRQELLADVWGISFDPGTNVVDVYIGRLRSKLAPVRIETVRNVGYRLAAG